MPHKRHNLKELKRLYEETEMPLTEIRKTLGIGGSTLYRLLYDPKTKYAGITKRRRIAKREPKTMTELEHAKKVTVMKRNITRKKNEAKKIPLLTDKIQAYRDIKVMEQNLQEFRLNFYALTRK